MSEATRKAIEATAAQDRADAAAAAARHVSTYGEKSYRAAALAHLQEAHRAAAFTRWRAAASK